MVIVASFLACSIASWFVLNWMHKRYLTVRKTFEYRAGQGFAEMFLFLDAGQVWTAGAIISLAAGLLSFLLTSSPVVALSVWLAALFLPQAVLRHLRSKRLIRLERQLPDLLLSLAGALRAGVGVQSALKLATQNMPQPLAQELGLIQREQRMGVSLDQALEHFGERLASEGASLVVSALRISMHTGGNLAETLETLAGTLRARLHLKGRINALTAQGRMQSWVMALLPPGLAWALWWLDPDAMHKLWTTPAGWAVLGLVVVLEVVGMAFVRRIVTINV